MIYVLTPKRISPDFPFKFSGSQDLLAFFSMKLSHFSPDKQAKMVFAEIQYLQNK